MKLVLINAESGKGGGPATIVDDIYTNFCNKDNEALIAYGRQCNDKTDVNRYKIGGKFNLLFHVLITRLFDKHGLGSVIATKKLIKVLEEYSPDIINIHNIHGYYLNYKLLFRYFKKNQLPVVWTFHDCWPMTGHCAYFDLAGCDKWKTHCGECPQKTVYPSSKFIDASYRNYELKKELFAGISDQITIVTPSAWLGDLVKQSFLKNCQIKVINNGIDLNVFKPQTGDFKKSHGIEDKIMVLALASEWTPRKGFDDVIAIGQELGPDYQLVMVGLSEEKVSEVPKEIIAITRTDNVQQLVEIYSEADVFMNASVEDNFPTVILEALACGTPVATYDTGGCREEINPSCGILVDKYDRAGLMAAVKSLGKKTDAVSQACIEKAKTFEKKAMYDKYNSLFEELVNSNT